MRWLGARGRLGSLGPIVALGSAFALVLGGAAVAVSRMGPAPGGAGRPAVRAVPAGVLQMIDSAAPACRY